MQSIILAESVIANTAKSTYQKKYKCPYCDKRFVRAKLHIHIQNEHEDLIPEGYTALRVAFNTINHKTEGHCIMCGAVTDWNEDKGRYERLCNNPKCHEAYKKMVAERTKKKYGTERLQTDPEYAEYVQRKALAGRKMHGEYKFADGGVIEYFGSYEKKFLQFMDQIMHCKSEDILAPAPSIKYMYNGEQHLYIPDFYYIPYNLIIEIKDGGSNPNNHPHRTGEDELKLRCKEEAIKQLNEFSYVRVVNNDFSQVLSIMAVLKYNMAHRYKDPVIKVNESARILLSPIYESILINEKDIYYNKDKFDSGEINLCFITGLSGSGKSTMGRDMQSHGVENYELDDLWIVADRFTFDDLKKYGDLIYSYFTGEGKKFYKTLKEVKDEQIPSSEYEDKMFPGFVHYAMKYAKAHNDRKFVLNGVWLYNEKWFTPDEFKDYAFYIKGTSMIISHIRASKRDSKDAGSEFKQRLDFIKRVTREWKWEIIDERSIRKFRKYFKDLMSKKEVVESMSGTIGSAIPLTPNPIPYESDKDNYYIIQHMENNAFAYSLTKDPVQYTMYSVDPEAKGFYKVFKSDKSKINKKYSTFKIRDRQKAKELYDELAKIESSNSKTFFAGDTSNDYIYQRLTEGSKIISDDQIRYDTRFEEVKNFNEEVQDICESVRNFILGDPITRLEEQVSTLSNLVNINESSNYVSSDYDMITSIEDYDNKVLKAKTAEQMGLIILYPEFKYGTCNKNTIDKLKKKYADFNALTQEKRTLSNRTAYHIFGYDNDTLYSKLLNLYVSTTMKSGGGSEGYSYNTMRSITPPIEQYYKPGEKVGTVSSDTKVARESFTDDSSWIQSVSKLCLKANNTSDTKKKNDLKNEIINLGWNPEIPFNEEAITRVKNMRHNLHIFTEVDAEEYIRNIHTFNEATYNQLKDKIVPVFICLFKGKSLHSRGIELYTGSEWSHAAMSFDSSMKQMYTFNMNPKVTSDGISKGFTIESIEAYWKIDPSIKFKVHALFVTKEQKVMMEDAIKWYVIHQNETKYSFKTIINIALKRVSDFGSEYANKTEMVCSQFVYTILAIADFKTKVTKDASLVSPGDLDTSIDDRLYSMFIGGIGLYSSKKIDRMVRQIIPTLPLDKYNI